MAVAKAESQTLGYLLNSKTTEFVEEFQKMVNENFKWLEEILAEAKEHFGRRDNALLPKTPCMKRKRKHIQRTPEEFNESCIQSSSPLVAPSVDDIKTPESKKPAIRSPLRETNETVEETLDVSVQKNTRKRGAKKQPARTSKRQQPKRSARNSKKAVVILDESDTNEMTDKSSPKHTTRSRRKQNSNTLQEEKGNKLDDKNEEVPPKQATRSKRKQTVEDIQEDKVESTSVDINEIVPRSPDQAEVSKKIRLSEADGNDLKEAEVFIPETPEIRAFQNSKVNEKSLKPCKVTASLVLASPNKASPANALSVIQETSEVSESHPIIVEVQSEEANNQEHMNGKRRSAESPVLRRSKRLTRSSDIPCNKSLNSTNHGKEKSEGSPKVRRSKRLTNSSDHEITDGGLMGVDNNLNVLQEDEDNDIPLVTTSTPVQYENNGRHHDKDESPQAQIITVDAGTSDDAEEPVVSSTVGSPGHGVSHKRQSSPSPQKSKRQRKSKQKSLVKSSVKLKLMPPLTPTSSAANLDGSVNKSDDDVESLKKNLFADGEVDDVQTVVNKVTDPSDCGDTVEQKDKAAPSSVTSSESSTDMLPGGEGSNSDDTEDDEGEEVFHDAPENLDKNYGRSKRPQTRASSRNKNTSDSSNGNSSLSSLEEAEQRETIQETKTLATPERQQFGPDTGVKLAKAKNIVLANSFVKRNTPKKVDLEEKNRQLKQAMKEKAEKEKERIELLEVQKQRKIEEQKRKREEREKRVAELRAAQAREKEERKKQLEQKEKLISTLTEKARKKKEKEEEAKRKVRQQKKAELDARRKLEEETRKQKLLDQEEETRRHEELLQRKQEFEEQERQRKIIEAKRQHELREQEIERERDQEKARKVKEMDDRERKAREDKDKADRKAREEREKEEKERKRIANLLKEKAERERRERELKAREDKIRQERENRLREEREKAQQQQKEEERRRKREMEARLRAEEVPDVDSYEMTPPPPPRVRSAVIGENYNIDDLCSDDSTDDEDAPKKRIPGWAQGCKLKATLLNQEMNNIDTNRIFGHIDMPDLCVIFQKQKKKRFFQRTSSAHWSSPPLKTLNRGTFV